MSTFNIQPEDISDERSLYLRTMVAEGSTDDDATQFSLDLTSGGSLLLTVKRWTIDGTTEVREKLSAEALITAWLDAITTPPVGDGVTFNVGDVVRLTGQTWPEWGIANEVVTISGHDTDGRPVFISATDSTGPGFVIYVGDEDGDGGDYSATLVSAAITTKEDA